MLFTWLVSEFWEFSLSVSLSISNIVLNLKATQSADGKTFALLEDTGDYDVSTNPTGFGAPNYLRTEIGFNAGVPLMPTGIRIEVMLPGSTSWEYGLDVPVTFIDPGGSGNNIFTISPPGVKD